METITELVRNLALLLLAAAFLELLLPKGRLSSLLRLVLGLLMMAALLFPFRSQLQQEENLQKWAEALAKPVLTEDYAGQGQALGAALTEEAAQLYQTALEEEIEKLILAQSAVTDVEVELRLGAEQQIEGMELLFFNTEMPAARDCAEHLAARLGLDMQVISWQIATGEVPDENK